jgi:glycosyltransferase involved in cell wall biosynthesis
MPRGKDFPGHSEGLHMMDSFWRSGEKPTVCIISPNKNAYSETFIRAHIERLPADVKVLYGGWFPRYRSGGELLLPQVTLPRRLILAIMRRILKLPWDYFEKAALKQFLLENKVDAVLAEYGPTGVAIRDVCKEANVPLIVHFHGVDAYEETVLEQQGEYYPELFEMAQAIVVVSHDMERQLLHLGASAKKLHYNPYGVDVSFFQGANPIQAAPVFLAIGRFVDKKAPHLTLLAFKKVYDAYPEAVLIMFGDGPLWEACKQLSQALGVAEAVKLVGRRGHHEVAAAMRNARAFVQHSIRTTSGNSEGTPVAVLEAGAAGLPVVATRHAGIPDVVTDGETGFLVDEGDMDSMADRMIKLAKDSALAAQLGKAARKRICAEFYMERSISNLWNIIESAIQEHKKR